MKLVLVLLLAGISPAMGLSADSADLVTIRVKGTSIDLLPKAVDVMVSNPGRTAQQLVAKGGNANKGIPHSVLYKGVLYVFKQPSSCTTQGTHRFKDKDVVYTYHAESDTEREAFAKKHKLKVRDRLTEQGGSAPVLYLASPGYYVIVLVKQTAYICAMHPRVIRSEEGQCPDCGMDLVPIEIYQ